jgi:hypothetical protein
MLPVRSNGLEELYDAFRCYFWLPIWARRFLEVVFIFRKSPNQVRLSSFIIEITPARRFSVLMHFNRSRNLGVILSII